MPDMIYEGERQFHSIQEQIAYHLAVVKRLRASLLRSDWHAPLEAALRCTFMGFEESYRLLVEEELGFEPPRVDFIVLVEEEGAKTDEAIFRHFRTHNIIEYKNPHDQLNESVLWKAIGYAGLYISGRGVDADAVTITIMRARRNDSFFDSLTAEGRLSPTDIPGVYNVKDRLPIRIILTDELKGEKYATYRAISDRPSEADVEYLIDAAKADEGVRQYIRVILNLVAQKNPKLIEKIKGRDDQMAAKWMEIFKEEIQQRDSEVRLKAFAEMVGKGLITFDQAANALNMTVDEFKMALENLKVTA